MSYRCGDHGWSHMLKPCPSCQPDTITTNSCMIPHNSIGQQLKNRYELEKMSTPKTIDEMFDHPCRDTCSGWKHGFDKGRYSRDAEVYDLKEQYSRARIELRSYDQLLDEKNKEIECLKQGFVHTCHNKCDKPICAEFRLMGLLIEENEVYIKKIELRIRELEERK